MMKKIAVFLIAMVGFVFAANAQQAKKSIEGDYDNTVIASVSNDSQTSTSITFYNNSTKSIKVCVKVYNDSNVEIAQDCFTIPGAPKQGSSRSTTVKVSKPGWCSSLSGCEVKSIEITEAKVAN